MFERRWLADGGIRDTSVEGFNKGGSLHFSFAEVAQGGQPGTDVGITIRLPLPPLLGWLAPVLRAQGRKEVRAAALEDKRDIEQRGYLPRPSPRPEPGPIPGAASPGPGLPRGFSVRLGGAPSRRRP
ncbi:MAG: hypothetical protein ACRECD_05845 [Burkholderiaceae bacterium]